MTWFVAWLFTLGPGWFLLDCSYRLWRDEHDARRFYREAWRWTINDLEAANRRIRELEAERQVIPGDEWKL